MTVPSGRAEAATRGESSMRREIGVWLGVWIVVNATIGTGIFKTPAKVARLTGSLDAYMLVWVAGGVIALCGALSLAELSAALPRTGGLYEYLRRAYGKTVAFLFGWTMLTLLIPSAVGSFARLAAEAILSLFALSVNDAGQTLLAVGVLVVCACANLLSARAAAAGQSAISVAKYVGVMLLALIGLFVPVASDFAVAAPVPPLPTQSTVTLAGCFTALVSVMWAYDGWADLSRISGEIREPARTLPRALILGTVAILGVYLLANAGYMTALGLQGLQHSSTGPNMPAANLAFATLGTPGRALLSVLVLVSCIGCCMTSLLTAPRVFVAMAADGLFPKSLGAVSERTGVPVRAIGIAALTGVLYITFRSFEQLTDAFVVGFFPFYMLGVIAVAVLRKKEPDLPRPFQVPLYPLVPIIFLLGATALLAGGLLDADQTALFAFAVMFAGLPVRWLSARVAKIPTPW